MAAEAPKDQPDVDPLKNQAEASSDVPFADEKPAETPSATREGPAAQGAIEASREQIKANKEQIAARWKEIDMEAERDVQEFSKESGSWWQRVKGLFKKTEMPVDPAIEEGTEKAKAAHQKLRSEAEAVLDDKSNVIDLAEHRKKAEEEAAAKAAEAAVDAQQTTPVVKAEASVAQPPVAKEVAPPLSTVDTKALQLKAAWLSEEYDRLAEAVAQEGAKEKKVQKWALKEKLNLGPTSEEGKDLNETLAELNRVKAELTKRGPVVEEAPAKTEALEATEPAQQEEVTNPVVQAMIAESKPDWEKVTQAAQKALHMIDAAETPEQLRAFLAEGEFKTPEELAKMSDADVEALRPQLKDEIAAEGGIVIGTVGRVEPKLPPPPKSADAPKARAKKTGPMTQAPTVEGPQIGTPGLADAVPPLSPGPGKRINRRLTKEEAAQLKKAIAEADAQKAASVAEAQPAPTNQEKPPITKLASVDLRAMMQRNEQVAASPEKPNPYDKATLMSLEEDVAGWDEDYLQNPDPKNAERIAQIKDSIARRNTPEGLEREVESLTKFMGDLKRKAQAELDMPMDTPGRKERIDDFVERAGKIREQREALKERLANMKDQKAPAPAETPVEKAKDMRLDLLSKEMTDAIVKKIDELGTYKTIKSAKKLKQTLAANGFDVEEIGEAMEEQIYKNWQKAVSKRSKGKK